MKPKNTRLLQSSRIIAAAGYSWKGIRAAFQKEQAFRDEVMLVAVLAVALLFLPLALSAKLLLLASLVMVLVVELLNSGLEALVDLVSPEFHELAGMAKDCGSAAVSLTLLAVGLFWGGVIWGGW